MVGRIDHVAIVTANTADVLATYQGVLGLPATATAEHSTEHVRITFLGTPDSLLEVIEPTSPDSGVARFLDRRGPGLHHLCFEVDDIVAEIARLQASGLEVLDQTPRHGLHGERLAFVHPRSVHGVLIELIERGSRPELAFEPARKSV